MIDHPVDRKQKGDEARANLRYVLHKIKDDQLARLALTFYLKLATIFGAFQ
jgi:hypothetical protein